MATVLSGTSGALYYKPAGTTSTFVKNDVDTSNDDLTVDAYLNFKVGDPVEFDLVNTQTGAAGSGTLPAGLSAGTTYYVTSYTASSGVLEVSASLGGTAVDITDQGTLPSPNAFRVKYADFVVVGQVRDWSFEVSREEIDVTTIGQAPGQYVPFRTFISGFGDGSGSATVYMTDEDAALSNRMVEDVMQRRQVGAAFKLYTEQVFSSGSVSDTQSRFIEFEAVLTQASMNINPDDAQSVTVNFRPSGSPSFDFSKA